MAVNADTYAVLLGVLATAAAIGLSPYAALAAAGLAASLGVATLPAHLGGLSTPGVWGVLLLLTLVDGILSRYRLPDLAWNAGHTLIRPLAAALYASAAAAGEPRAVQWIAAASALLAALLVHSWVLAVRTGSRTAGPISWCPGFTALRLGAAAVIGVLALLAAPYAAAVAAVIILTPLPWASRLWGAAGLTLSSLLSVLTRPAALQRWETGAERLPRRMKAALETELGYPVGPARLTRATLARLGSRWLYRRGRFVVAHGKPPVFVHRNGFGAAVIRLEAAQGRADHGTLVETVEIEARAPYALCLGPGAPPGPAVLAELESSASGH